MLNQRYELRHLNGQLAPEIRRLMIAELHWAVEHDKLYYSKHFTATGREKYPLLLQNAFANGTPDTLEESLNLAGYFQPDSPKTAAQTFAWDEFNKFYMRALCLLAQNRSESDLVVVRGRHSDNPKPESNRLLGAKKHPGQFLNGLRVSPG